MDTSSSHIDFVIPAHNAQGTIERTLISLRNQSNPEWTAIVVDDGSSDQTGTIATQINDHRIRIMRQTNQGPSKARNHGFGIGRSKLVCFLDADDTIYPDFVEQIISIASMHRIGASCGYDYRDIHGRVIHRVGTLDHCRLSPDGMRQLDPPAIMSMVYQRSALESLTNSGELLFNESMNAFEDWDMLNRLLNFFECDSRLIGRCDQTLASYWCTPGSLSSSLEAVWNQGHQLITSGNRNQLADDQVVRSWSLGMLGSCIITNDDTTTNLIRKSIGSLYPNDATTIANAMRWQIMRQHGIPIHDQGELDTQIIERCKITLQNEQLIHTITDFFACMKTGRIDELLLNASKLLANKGRLVIFGLGRNGIEFVSHAKLLGLDVVLTDDQPDQMRADPRRISPCSIRPDDVVIVTPDHSSAIVHSLSNIDPKRVFIYQHVDTSSVSSARSSTGYSR
tara:strand:- start:566499 stop:567857 length:1359 start_codon:yes stop_codon:yes gene_type:complete